MEKNYLTKTSSKTSLFIKNAALLVLVIFSFSKSYGQGTTCSDAISVTINGACAPTATVSDTTADLPALTSCTTGTFRVERWYTFTVTGGPLNVSVTAISTNKNLFLQLISQSTACADLTQIACANAVTTPNAGQTETISNVLLGNGTYYVKVVNVGNGGTMGLTSLCVTSTITNNDCSGAIGLTVNPSTTCTASTNATTVGATQSQVGCTGNADDDVWFSFVASSTTHVITVTPNTLNNAVFEVFAGNTCGALGAGICVNNTTGANVETSSITGFTVGLTYYVRVYSQGNATNAGTFNICVTSPPANNQCANATSLPCGTTNLAGSTIGTASFTHGTGCTMSSYGVWYTFVGDGNQNTISATGLSFDLEMSISRGSCGSLTNITCQDAATGTGTETYTFNTVVGTTYYVYIAHWDTGTTIGSFTISRTCVPPLTNDDCSGAIALTTNTTCNYVTYSNIGATASTGISTPGCGGYSGGDVWFSVLVPATGEINIDLQAGTMTDSGIALYSGTCGALTQLDCDDDSSNNGLMSFISRNGLTPGQTIYIRVWEYGNDNNGTFGICSTTPSCPSPSDLFANITSATSVTVNWTNSSPPASGGYQYYVNTTGVAPTAGTTPTGSTAAGVIGVVLSGLTTGQTYYFWVRSYCGGSDVSTWFGPTNYKPCAIGNSNGTTTLSCPSVLAGGVGMSGGNPAAMNCSALSCVNLEATYLQINQPTNYTVTQITDPPPYQFTCLKNPVSVNIDDVWSQYINLPFNFCFYGNNYDRCLIGSNGVITFDTTTYTPAGRNEWEFFNNLPNANLLRNTIFGVYQDIDPSKGGQVGWELINLNSGCRALVAAWNDIPMYSSACNSRLYTGMIVLYENTNVIDVYIKEKNVCGSWNDGNAIVGLQNAAGNAAVVAPGRNALDTNWTATNEAWRFTPSGTSLTTIQWYLGNATTGTPISSPAPVTVGDRTTSTINVCPTDSSLYTAQVTYARCNGNLTFEDNAIVTINGNKVWNGATSNDWNIGTNWTPNGVPTNTNCVIVPVTSRNPVISNTPNAVGYNLAVNNGAQLTMNPNQNLIITDRVLVQPTGNFTINNNSNLIQINNTATNTGNIFYKRIAPNIKGSDYVYWSSPVVNQNMATIYDSGSQGYRYQWNTTVNNNNGASGNVSQGNWEAASGTMSQARGYIIRGSSNFNQAAGNIPTTFNGVPSNGIIPYTIQRGVYTGAPYNGANGIQIINLDDNYNLLGNPYPSSMNALAFLQANTYNASTNPTGRILGNVKLWTHGTDPLLGVVNPFYGSYLYNYDANDYLTLNYLGSTTPGVTDIIRSGQAFFVQMVDGATGSGSVTFDNSMRYDGSNNPYTNSGFFKNGNTTNSEDPLERHRIWLDLVDANFQSSGILVGYATGATNENDALFDAPTSIPGGMKLFSIIDNETDIFDIQGRTLPFNIYDEIPVGIKAPTQGNYTFAIAALDGLFENQNVYIKDTLLNITHNLKTDPYHFTTTSGIITDRFKIVYTDNALGTPLHEFDENSIKVITNNELAVSSSNLDMKSISVFNLLGQKLDTYENVNSNYVILSNLHKNNATLLLKIKLYTGETVTKKIIF